MKEHQSRHRATCLVVLALAAVLLSTGGCESDNPLLLEGLNVTSNTVNLTVELLFDLLKTLWTDTSGG